MVILHQVEGSIYIYIYILRERESCFIIIIVITIVIRITSMISISYVEGFRCVRRPAAGAFSQDLVKILVNIVVKCSQYIVKISKYIV